MSIRSQDGQKLVRGPRPADRTGSEPSVWFSWNMRLSLLLAVLAVLCLVTLREGHSWGDDFALYILHARNLIEGRSYGATGYVYNPATPWYSPRVYPPGFPMLLAPLYAAFGLNLAIFRLVVVASFVAMVAVFALIARRMLPSNVALAAAALVAFQPFLLRFKNLLIPDLTFTLFMLLTLYLVQRLQEERGWQARYLALGVVAGLCLAFAISLRTIGVTFFGALGLFCVLRRRLPAPPVFACLVTVLVLVGIVSLTMPPASGYSAQRADMAGNILPQLEHLVQGVPRDILMLGAATDVLWAATGEQRAPNFQGAHRVLIRLLMGGSAILMVIGFVVRLRKFSIIEAFPVTYVGALVVWNATHARYLVPVIPLLILYGVVGATYLAGRRIPWVNAVLTVFGTIVVVTYAGNLLHLDRRPYANGVTGENAVRLYDYVRSCTPPDALLASTWPRALTLYTGRPAMRLGVFEVRQEERLAHSLTRMGYDYVVALTGSDLEEAVARWPETFIPAYANEQWRVFRVRTNDGTSPIVSHPDCTGT